MSEFQIIEMLMLIGLGGGLWYKVGKLEGILKNGLNKRLDEFCQRLKNLERKK